MGSAVEVDHVTKVFRLHTEPSKTLKERVLNWRANSTSEFAALSDVTLDVSSGDTLGLLGHNGSGKSTLLKCIAGTLRPTVGEVRVNGRMSAMLELGAGFHPDLTGRENVYLNGSILGFSKDHIRTIFDDIVEFSELGEFIDGQVKHYSSGMYARLGFAVAVNLEPDILLVDEVLSVGDEAFQRKCIERVRQFQADGRTIILVTHSPDQVQSICDRGAVLEQGRLIYAGDPTEAVAEYRRSLDSTPEAAAEAIAVEESTAEQPPSEEVPAVEVTPTSQVVAITDVRLADPPPGRRFYAPGDELIVDVAYDRLAAVESMRARLIIEANDGVRMLNVSTYDIDGTDIWDVAESGVVRFRLAALPFLDHRYHVSVVLQHPHETEEFDRAMNAAAFDVVSGGPIIGRAIVDLAVEHQQLRR